MRPTQTISMGPTPDLGPTARAVQGVLTAEGRKPAPTYHQPLGRNLPINRTYAQQWRRAIWRSRWKERCSPVGASERDLSTNTDPLLSQEKRAGSQGEDDVKWPAAVVDQPHDGGGLGVCPCGQGTLDYVNPVARRGGALAPAPVPLEAICPGAPPHTRRPPPVPPAPDSPTSTRKGS